MQEQDYEQLTLFQADFRVNPFPWLETRKGKRMIDTSGPKCFASSERLRRVGLSVRTYLESSTSQLTTFVPTWSVRATKSGYLILKLRLSERRTDGNGLPLWPTPTTGAGLCGGTGNFQQLKALKEAGVISEEERRNMSQGNGGQLNPEFVEYLMNFSRGWTQLD